MIFAIDRTFKISAVGHKNQGQLGRVFWVSDSGGTCSLRLNDGSTVSVSRSQVVDVTELRCVYAGFRQPIFVKSRGPFRGLNQWTASHALERARQYVDAL